jgi:nucleotide-binding universal stress UspA family protein
MSILAAIDREPGVGKVIETAEELATALDEELVLLHVVSEGDNVDKSRNDIENRVREARGDLDGVDVRVAESVSERDVPSGRIGDRILRMSDQVGARYIVTGSRGRTPVGKVMLGSVAQHVLVHADVPVVTVGDND